jgi:hypothetical protein
VESSECGVDALNSLGVFWLYQVCLLFFISVVIEVFTKSNLVRFYLSLMSILYQFTLQRLENITADIVALNRKTLL